MAKITIDTETGDVRFNLYDKDNVIDLLLVYLASHKITRDSVKKSKVGSLNNEEVEWGNLNDR